MCTAWGRGDTHTWLESETLNDLLHVKQLEQEMRIFPSKQLRISSQKSAILYGWIHSLKASQAHGCDLLISLVLF